MFENPQTDWLPVVLVVDDDVAIRETFANVLRDERYVVATASDGAEALALLRAGFRPTVVLLDLWMPRTDGREALAMLKSDPVLARIPVIVVTADREARREEVVKTADAFLPKPVDLDALLEQIWEQSLRAKSTVSST